MFQLSTTLGRRNRFHIFLSLSVNIENELAKIYCVSRLQLQKFTSLKLHHVHNPWIVFFHQEKCLHQILVKFQFPFTEISHSPAGGYFALPLQCYLENSCIFYLSITRCGHNFHTFLQFDCELGFNLTLPKIKCP